MMDQQTLSSNTGTRSWLSWRVVLVLGLAFLIYLPAIRSGFIWDDDFYVTSNTALKNLRGLWDIWFHPVKLPQYYPLTFSSFWINYQLWGLHPAGYHLVNILLHALNSIFIWRLLERLKVQGAWFAGLLFLVHPVNVESVAWITERKNVLSGLFYLTAFLSYLRFKEEKARRLYFVSFALFLGALLSKTVTGTFPAAVLLILWWKEGPFPRKDLLRMVPFFIAAMILGSVAMSFENGHIVGMGSVEWIFSFPERLLIAGRAAWFYLGKLIWPYPLIFIYPRWTIDSLSAWQWLFPSSFILLGVGLWTLRQKLGRGPLFALAFFTVTIFPALGFKSFFPMWFSFVADHFQYLASIAPLALGSAVCLKAFGKYPRIRTWLAAMTLVVLSLLTWQQCHIYKDLFTLWQDTLKKNPSAWMAHNNIGNLLSDRSLDDEAEWHFCEVIRIKPDEAQAYANLGVLMEKKGLPEKALECFQQAVRFRPNSGMFWNNLGSTLIGLGRIDEAISNYMKAIELDPTYEAPRYNLGNVLFMLEDTEKAAYWYQKALEINPENKAFHVSLGTALAKLGQTKEAVASYKKALELDPNHAMAHNNLANLLDSKDRLAEAEHHYQEAIRLEPGSTLFRNNYASLLAEHGRTDEAVEVYNDVLRRDPKNPKAQSDLRRLAFGFMAEKSGSKK